jgi:hypothetical protein
MEGKAMDAPPQHCGALIVSSGFSHKKTDTTVIPQPPHSPDLAPADFFLFPELKCTFKGRRFATTEEIKENSLRDLKAIPKQAFQD